MQRTTRTLHSLTRTYLYFCLCYFVFCHSHTPGFNFITLHICSMQIHHVALHSVVTLQSVGCFFFYFYFISIQCNKSSLKKLYIFFRSILLGALNRRDFFPVLTLGASYKLQLSTVNIEKYFFSFSAPS